MSARYPADGQPPDDPPYDPDGADLPKRTPEEMAQHLVVEVDNIAIDSIKSQIRYWNEALKETKRLLDDKAH
ncbi:MAG: hypothetical protein ACR2OX_04810 [Methyloligellaceae bacterium]